jgi:hypothetical protein
MVTYHASSSDGLRVRPRGSIPLQGLTARELRRLPLRLGMYVAMSMERHPSRWGENRQPLFPGTIDRVSGSGKPARRGRDREDDFYAGIAERYLEALREAPHRPNAWLSERYAEAGQKVTPANIRDWVHQARVRGFLAQGRRGHLGAEPTGKLAAWRRTVAAGRERSYEAGVGCGSCTPGRTCQMRLSTRDSTLAPAPRLRPWDNCGTKPATFERTRVDAGGRLDERNRRSVHPSTTMVVQERTSRLGLKAPCSATELTAPDRILRGRHPRLPGTCAPLSR